MGPNVEQPSTAWNGIYGDMHQLRTRNSEYPPLLEKLQANLNQGDYITALRTLADLKANRSEVELHEAQLFPKNQVDTRSRFQTVLAPEDKQTSASMHVMIMDAVRDQQYKTAVDLIFNLVAKQDFKPVNVECAFSSLISEVKDLLRDSKYGEALDKFDLLDCLNLARSLDSQFKDFLINHNYTLRDLWNPNPETAAKNRAFHALDNRDIHNARKWIEVAQAHQLQEQLLELKMNAFCKDIHNLFILVDKIELDEKNGDKFDTLKALSESYKKLEPILKVILENDLVNLLLQHLDPKDVEKLAKVAFLTCAHHAMTQNDSANCGRYLAQYLYFDLLGIKANPSMN